MAVYTVHEPPRRNDDALAHTDRFMFVRDGFSWPAFLFAPLWMLRYRLWLALIVYLLVVFALGTAVRALGDMKGITRYADVHVPMDEALTRVAIDISGRPFLVFKAEFGRDKVGAFDTELVCEWFQAFAINAGVTLHVETLYGSNDHHIAESCFKGLARALRAAVAIDARAAGEVPSTKGRLGG